MKRFTLFILAACAAAMIAACVPASNTTNTSNANTNANSAPKAAAPTVDALVALEKQANEAWAKSDAKFFEGFLSDKFVMYEGGKRMGKAELLDMIGKTKCDVKTWSLEEPKMTMIDPDTAVIVQKGVYDGTCDGQKLPSPTRSVSVYQRSGDKWLGVYHGEVAIAQAAADSTKKEEGGPAKKEEAKPADKPATANTASNSSANSNSNTTAAKPAPPTPSANTNALAKLHNDGWTAFKNKDAKWFEDHLTSNAGAVDPTGAYLATKADVIKAWTTMPCENITKVNFTDAFATALSSTVEILTGKGNADGTCNGMKNGDLYQTAVYVKEGDAWKLAFMVEAPPAS